MAVSMKLSKGTVIENIVIGDRVFRMTVEAPDVALFAKPGQFINVYPRSKDTLLPRPISLCWVDGGTVTLVYGVVGKGTEAFSRLMPGENIVISPAMGNGYDLDVFDGVDKPSALLCGGGIGIPPLLELTARLKERGASVTAVIGFKESSFLVKPFLKAGADLYVATDSGNEGFKGTVIDLMKSEGLTAHRYFACGPKPMLQAFTEHCLSMGADPQISMEERMGCGYGACVGCVVRTTGGMKKACKDGPVFKGSEVIWK